MKHVVALSFLFLISSVFADELAFYDDHSDNDCKKIKLNYLNDQNVHPEYTCESSKFVLADIESIVIEKPILPEDHKKCSSKLIQFSQCYPGITIRLPEKDHARLRNWSENKLGDIVFLVHDRSIILFLAIRETIPSGEIYFHIPPRTGIIDPEKFFAKFTDNLQVID